MRARSPTLLARGADPARRARRPTKRSACPTTAEVVLTNRSNPPDAILREVYERTGDKPFDRIDDVISARGARGHLERYKRVAGYRCTWRDRAMT